MEISLRKTRRNDGIIVEVVGSVCGTNIGHQTSAYIKYLLQLNCYVTVLSIPLHREMWDLFNVNEGKGLNLFEIENGIVDMTQTGDSFDR